MVSSDRENAGSGTGKLRDENLRLNKINRELQTYLMEKINQLLIIIGTKPLKPEELEISSIVELDVLGTLAISYKQVLDHQNRTNSELERSREFLNTLVQMAPNGLFTIDIEGNITSWNEKAEEITGFSREDVLGKICVFRQHCGECLLLNRDVNKPILDHEFEYIDSKGNLKYLSQNMDVLHDEKGEPVGGITSFVDITERKKAEEVLEKYRYHLEELIENRTRELEAANEILRKEIMVRKRAEGELKKANIELRKVDELKNNIISNVSHELKTPLAIIKSSLELSLDEDDEMERNEILTAALKSVHRQNDIIEDLIAVSRINLTRKDIIIHLVNLNESVSMAIDDLKEKASKRGIKIIFESTGNIPLIEGNSLGLRRAVRNLIDNGIKFNKTNGEVLIGLVHLKKEKKVIISVKDTGIGIKPKDQERIFDNLTQLDPSTSRKFEGTGMGLAVVKKIAELHGGQVSLESQPGKGSVFYLKLPVKVL